MPTKGATHCPQGHAYDAANTYVYNGKQHCRRCRAAQQRRYQRRLDPGLKAFREYIYRTDSRNAERMFLIRRRATIKKRFGLTIEQYEAILAKGCAICGTDEQLVLDHHHDSGVIRDALCSRCNWAIGLLLEDPERARAAAEYLERHGGPTDSH